MSEYKQWYIDKENNCLTIVDADKEIPENAITPTLAISAPELLEALINLQKELHANIKMNVKKNFGLLLADAQASTAIYHARGGK